jgi:hypothetical protein
MDHRNPCGDDRFGAAGGTVQQLSRHPNAISSLKYIALHDKFFEVD